MALSPLLLVAAGCALDMPICWWPRGQVRAGAVAERVATEGVMLQYAVDCKLDVLLSSVYASLTQPPMPLNPYPRLLHFLRAHAARLDLWRVRVPFLGGGRGGKPQLRCCSPDEAVDLVRQCCQLSDVLSDCMLGMS
jgi:hypothetical protein